MAQPATNRIPFRAPRFQDEDDGSGSGEEDVEDEEEGSDHEHVHRHRGRQHHAGDAVKKAAAALSVGVGHFTDPWSLQVWLRGSFFCDRCA